MESVTSASIEMTSDIGSTVVTPPSTITSTATTPTVGNTWTLEYLLLIQTLLPVEYEYECECEQTADVYRHFDQSAVDKIFR